MVDTPLSQPIRRARRDRSPNQISPLKYLALLPAVIYDGIFFLLPLVFLIWLGFWTTENYQAIPGFSLENYTDIFSQMLDRSRYGLAIGQSLWVATTSALTCIAVVYPFVLMVIFGVPVRFRRLFLLLAIIPFWSSYILRLYSWQVIIAKNGILAAFLNAIGLPIEELPILYTQMATRIGLVHFLFPIMTILMFVVVRNIDQNLIEAARDLGATRWQVFRRVIFPLSKVGLVNSFFLGTVISLGDVLASSILGGGTGISILGKLPLFSGMIMTDYAASTNLPRTSALATILVLIMILVVAIGFRISTQVRREVG